MLADYSTTAVYISLLSTALEGHNPVELVTLVRSHSSWNEHRNGGACVLPLISYEAASSLGHPLLGDYSTTAVCISLLSTVLEGRYTLQPVTLVRSHWS